MRNFDWRDLLRYEGGSILMILFGILLTVKPDLASAAVSALAGWALIAVGVAFLVAGFTDGLGVGRIVTGAVLLLAGSWLHRNPLMIAAVIGMMLGVLVLSQGWRAAKEVKWTKDRGGLWIPGAVLAVLELLIGVRLILSPLSLSRLVLSVAGIAMVICGVCNLVAHYRFVRYIPGADGIIDADE